MSNPELLIAFSKIKKVIKRIKNPQDVADILEAIEEVRGLVLLKKELLERKEKLQHLPVVTEENQNDPMRTPAEAAVQLGVERQTIYNKIKKGDIQASKTGAGEKDAVRIPQSELDRIKNGKSKR